MRKLLVVMAVSALYAMTSTVVARPSAPDQARARNRIASIGKNSFVRNALIQSTLRFTPERLVVRSGARVTIVDQDGPREPHTVSVVARRARPDNVDEVFACRACRVAGAHFRGDRPKIRVNQGRPGLNQPGDSILFLPNQTVRARVTAAAGSTLYYLCAIHPWMQGRIQVT
jgi:hypothetical protein